MTEISTRTAGIDTGKHTLDVAVHGHALRLSVANREAGWRSLIEALREAHVTRAGIEATGGYERGVVDALRAAGFRVLVLQPLQVKSLARLRLRRAKNDALDAALIAQCAAMLADPPVDCDTRVPPLADQLTFIEQIEEDMARQKNRLEHTAEARLRGLIEADIRRLRTCRTRELRRLAKAVREHHPLRRRFELVLSIPGLGERTALSIILRMPELGRLSREQAAALAGLAPFDDDSGQRQGQRHIAGGRDRLRRALYAAALPAAFHWNKALIALYRRLTAIGKPHRLALVACARKLIVYANAVVQRGHPWTVAQA